MMMITTIYNQTMQILYLRTYKDMNPVQMCTHASNKMTDKIAKCHTSEWRSPWCDFT